MTTDTSTPATPPPPSHHFIDEIILADNAALRWGQNADGTPKVHTRFPPEPNGYLHIGHAKSICLNSGLARRYGGHFNLRFDDTNPAKEEQEYVDSIIKDVKWLGADFDVPPSGGGLFYASNYFDQMYAWAVELVKKGHAYVCDLSAEEMSKRRGDLRMPATSPFRDRPMADTLRLLEEMRDGKHANGSRTLRARIDLASPNFVMRDPVMYRVVHEHHHNTGNRWCIFPMYDWAHCLEDSLEGITHSICTLEFRNNRPLYHWFIDRINEGRTTDGSGPWGKPIHHPQQIEFAKLRLTSVILSKRNLLRMVQEKVVKGWDDPRMPTLSGVRRRGFPAAAIRNFCEEVGVTTQDSTIDLGRLENSVRDHLNKSAPRAMGVLRPVKVRIENWPKNADGTPTVEMLDFVVNPEDEERGLASARRKIAFAGELFIEREDFMEVPAKKFFRLAPTSAGGVEVRLRWAYFIKATGVVKDASGEVTEIIATYDPATRGGDAPKGPDGLPVRKVKGTIHWVSALHAIPAEVRLFDRLFSHEEPGHDGPGGEERDFLLDLNPHSLDLVTARIDPYLAAVQVGDTFQFERLGYFRVDEDSKPGALVFNRTVTLKDSWSKAKE